MPAFGFYVVRAAPARRAGGPSTSAVDGAPAPSLCCAPLRIALPAASRRPCTISHGVFDGLGDVVEPSAVAARAQIGLDPAWRPAGVQIAAPAPAAALRLVDEPEAFGASAITAATVRWAASVLAAPCSAQASGRRTSSVMPLASLSCTSFALTLGVQWLSTSTSALGVVRLSALFWGFCCAQSSCFSHRSSSSAKLSML